MRTLYLALYCGLFVSSTAIGAGDSTADAVLGQPNFTQNAANNPGGAPTAANLALSNAAQLAIGPNGRLYVADADNNRILSWPSAAIFSTGQAADLVIGQPNFFSSAAGVSATQLNLPQGLCVDAAGDLWVADAFNSRVLKFVNPATTDTTADLVIGQANFVSGAPNLGRGPVDVNVASADSLCFPGRVWAGDGVVIIADSGNSRVLLYPTPVANKPSATRVWGQFGSFTCRAKNNDGACGDFGPTTARSLFNPIGIATGPGRRLYVCDWNNNRVLWFNDYLAGDDVADGAIGQPDFQSNACAGTSATSLCQPIDVALGGGRVLVTDAGNNRVLAFPAANHASAIFVLGQLDNFAGSDANHGLGPSAADVDGLFGPTGVAIDSNRHAYVADTLNNRVLRFDVPFVRPLGIHGAGGQLEPGAIYPVAP